MAELAEVSRGITESGEFRKGISSSSIVKNNSRERKTKLEREREREDWFRSEVRN